MAAKRIMCVKLQECSSIQNHFQYMEIEECENSEEFLEQGLDLLDWMEETLSSMDEEGSNMEIVQCDIWGTIYNVKPDAMFFAVDGNPVEMYWIEEEED